MNTEVKNWTFEQLTTYVVAEMFDAMITGGGQGMKSRFVVVFDVICKWQDAQKRDAPKPKPKRKFAKVKRQGVTGTGVPG